MRPTVYSVFQINSYIKRLLDGDVILSGVYIEGEISNFKEHSSGHLYFSLKDENASIGAVMFRSSAASLTFRPENGKRAIVCGRVSAYEKTGQYQLYVDMMEPSGTGGLYLAFIQLKARLESEGLFDVSRKRRIPPLPSSIGVVTSLNGAALRDIINVSRRRGSQIRLIIAPAAVQGASAAPEITGAINLLNERGGIDVIIVGRGGGSAEDLWAFNEEIVARAIAASRIPVVSAVGHETDFTICDFAADLRAPTPSAAAELCVPDTNRLRADARRLANRLNSLMLSSLSAPYRHLKSLTRRLGREHSHSLSIFESRLNTALQSLHSSAPTNVLKRGFALLYINGQPVKSAASIAEPLNKPMEVRLRDGSVYGIVKSINLGDSAPKPL